jgi:protoporphyrinogen oxidase
MCTQGDEEDESMHSFFSRRLGRFVADKVLTAVVSGVWAGDARKLSIRSCMPSLVESERAYGSLVLGALRAGLSGGGGIDPKVEPEVARALSLAGGPFGVFSFRNGVCMVWHVWCDMCGLRV